MSIAREAYFIYARSLRTWLAEPWTLTAAVASSAFMFLFFGTPLGSVTLLPGFPSQDYQAYLTGMVLVMAVVFSGSDMAMSVLTDMKSGYFNKLLLAPVNRFSILLGTMLVGGTRALAQVLAITLIALAIGVRFEGGVLGGIVIVAATTIFGVAMACVGLILALRTRSIQITLNSWLLFMPLAFLTSAFMPREMLAGWFRAAVTFNPVEYVMAAVRAIIIEGWAWGEILPGLWALLAMTVVVLAVTTLVYRRATA